jgi:predicted ArsR family transcriptional regulator
MAGGMHPTQRAILAHLTGRTIPPTFRELARALGISVGAMRHHLEILAAAGLVAYEPRLSRTLRITDQGRVVLAQREEGVSTHGQ